MLTFHICQLYCYNLHIVATHELYVYIIILAKVLISKFQKYSDQSKYCIIKFMCQIVYSPGLTASKSWVQPVRFNPKILEVRPS
jgi:sensor histidine kinase YesM